MITYRSIGTHKITSLFNKIIHFWYTVYKLCELNKINMLSYSYYFLINSQDITIIPDLDAALKNCDTKPSLIINIAGIFSFFNKNLILNIIKSYFSLMLGFEPKENHAPHQVKHHNLFSYFFLLQTLH